MSNMTTPINRPDSGWSTSNCQWQKDQASTRIRTGRPDKDIHL